MSSIDTCWTCGNSDIEAVEKIALAIEKRHDDGSSIEREWTNHHGLMRCDCAELVKFIRGRDKDFWDGMNGSLEQATGPDEIGAFLEDISYAGRLARDKANYPQCYTEQVVKVETGIGDDLRTQAGKDLFAAMNQQYGSAVWGAVLAGIREIEKEILG